MPFSNTIISLDDVDITTLSAGKFLRVRPEGNLEISQYDIPLNDLHYVEASGAYAPTTGQTLVYTAANTWRPATLDVYSVSNGLNKSGLTISVTAGSGGGLVADLPAIITLHRADGSSEVVAPISQTPHSFYASLVSYLNDAIPMSVVASQSRDVVAIMQAAEKLAKHFGSIDKLREASFEDLKDVDEIGEKIAKSVISYFSKPAAIEDLVRLKSAGLHFEINEEETLKSSLLSGESFVVSGVFENYSRNEMKELVEQNGGRIVGSISAKTNFVLAGENMGPAKLKKAESLGIKILSESEFLKMIDIN